MDRIHVIIIPNEDYLAIPVFSKTSVKKNHHDIIELFYKENNLPYDSDKNIYDDLLSYQNIVIITFSKTLVIFLPELITKNQITTLKSYTNFFKQYELLICGEQKEEEITEEYYDLTSSDTLKSFFEKVSTKNNSKPKEVHI